MTSRAWLLASLVLALTACTTDTPPTEEDTREPTVTRIATLSPGLTEMTFAAGAGDLLVGVSAYSDYPAAALALPIIGDAFALDLEQLALLQPDVLFVWPGGTPEHVIDELRESGYRIERLSTQSLADIAGSLRRIGELTGRQVDAEAAASAFETGVASRTEQFAGRSSVRVFYQISSRPLYTVNGDHVISEIITLCGGANIFADLDALAPTVAVEAILDRNPEAILTSSQSGPSVFDDWRRWDNLQAVQADNLFLVPGDAITRATPRLLAGIDAVCGALQTARDKRTP